MMKLKWKWMAAPAAMLLAVVMFVLPAAAQEEMSVMDLILGKINQMQMSENRQAEKVAKIHFGQMYMTVPEPYLEGVLNSPNVIDMGVTGVTYKYVEHNAAGQEGLLTDFSCTEYQIANQDSWTAFELGERACGTLCEMGNVGKMFRGDGRPPVDGEVLDHLLNNNDGGITIVGLDSACTTGTVVTVDGRNACWGALPFVVIEQGDLVLEDRIYMFFRLVVPVEEGVENAMEFFAADMQDVAELLEYMLETNPDIAENDRVCMEAYVRRGLAHEEL